MLVARMRLHARLQLAEVVHRLAIDGQDLIAGLQAGARRRPLASTAPSTAGTGGS